MSNPHGQDPPAAGEPSDPTADPPPAAEPTPAPWQSPQPPPPGWGQQQAGQQPGWQQQQPQQPQPEQAVPGSEDRTQNFRPDQVQGWGQQGWPQQPPPGWEQQQQAYGNQPPPQQQGWDQQQPPGWDQQQQQPTQVTGWGQQQQQQTQAWGQQQPQAWGQQQPQAWGQQQPGAWGPQQAQQGPWDQAGFGDASPAAGSKRSKAPWIIVAVVVVVLAAVGVLGFVTPGFFVTKVFDSAAVQDGVKRVLSTDYKIEGVGAVSCPANVQVTAGNTFTCTTTVNGKPSNVQITIQSTDGSYQVGRPA